MSAAGGGLARETVLCEKKDAVGDVTLNRRFILAARMPIAMVVVDGAAPPGSVLGGFESGGGAELIVGSDADT
jgi:hypothetical protein